MKTYVPTIEQLIRSFGFSEEISTTLLNQEIGGGTHR